MHLYGKHMYILWVSKLFVYLVGSTGGHPLADIGPTLESPPQHSHHRIASRSWPSTIHTVEGSVAKIDCNAPPNTPRTDVKFQDVTWFHDGEPIERGLDPSRPLKLTFKEVTLSDAGIIACRVAATSGRYHWTNTTLVVQSDAAYQRDHTEPEVPIFRDMKAGEADNLPKGPPRFLFSNYEEDEYYPAKTVLPHTAGTKLSLPCRATGNPEPEIAWTSDNELITTMRQDSSGSLNSTGDVSLEDSGNYYCTASNSFGNVTFMYQVIVVTAPDKLPPRIESDYPKNVTAYLGQSATFLCKLVSSAHPTVEWGRFPLVNGSVLVDKNGEPVPEVLSSLDKRYNLSDATVLIINNATYNDSGEYYCFVKSYYGKDMKMAFLTVRPIAPMPSSMTTLYVILGVVAAIIILIMVLSILHQIFGRYSGSRLVKRLASGDLPPGMRMKRHFKIYRKESSLSDGFTRPEYRYEDVGFLPAVEYSASANSGSIVTSRTTTISHCNSVIEYVDFNPALQFPRENLIFDPESNALLGEGAYGKVYKAQANNVRGRSGWTTVAVKTPKDDYPDSNQISHVMNLLNEMEIMGRMDHDNVIKLYGCCMGRPGEPLYIIMEYAEDGNLKDFLRLHRPTDDDGYLKPTLTPVRLVQFSHQIASGVKYLTDKKILHRDLAARNVLVAENYVMKVADFGLSKNVEGQDYYKKRYNKGLLPVKWMAPETMLLEQEYKYSTESDIWSYGVLMWEIMTFGAHPYPTKNTPDEIIEFLKSGRRLEKPENCPESIYRIMRDCWEFHPSDRPNFEEILRRLGVTLQDAADYLALGSRQNIYIVDNQEYMETASD